MSRSLFSKFTISITILFASTQSRICTTRGRGFRGGGGGGFHAAGAGGSAAAGVAAFHGGPAGASR